MKTSEELDLKLTRMIRILNDAKEENWVSYFEDVQNTLKKGQMMKAKKKIIGAYGGMGSFNDITLSFIDEETYQEALTLRKDLYTESNDLSIFQRIFG